MYLKIFLLRKMCWNANNSKKKDCRIFKTALLKRILRVSPVFVFLIFLDKEIYTKLVQKNKLSWPLVNVINVWLNFKTLTSILHWEIYKTLNSIFAVGGIQIFSDENLFPKIPRLIACQNWSISLHLFSFKDHVSSIPFL